MMDIINDILSNIGWIIGIGLQMLWLYIFNIQWNIIRMSLRIPMITNERVSRKEQIAKRMANNRRERFHFIGIIIVINLVIDTITIVIAPYYILYLVIGLKFMYLWLYLELREHRYFKSKNEIELDL